MNVTQTFAYLGNVDHPPSRTNASRNLAPVPYYKPRRPRIFLRLSLAFILVLAGIIGLLALRQEPQQPKRTGPPPFAVRKLTPAPHSAIPATAEVPEARDAWFEHLTSTTDLPSRALRAYIDAADAVRSTNPGCHLNWTTLAGIGRAESNHGKHNRSRIGPDGTVVPPIIGLPLDGSPGVKKIPDTDGGQLDGDTVWDRAMGPMQFIPKTWREWSVRASGDGAPPDPQNIDDAAHTAARYLCAVGGDLGTPDGWWNAMLTYNTSVSYAQKVFSNATAYAQAAHLP